MRDVAPFFTLAVLVLITVPMASARGQSTDGESGEQCCSWPPAEELQSQPITAASCQAKDSRFEVPRRYSMHTAGVCLTSLIWSTECTTSPMQAPSLPGHDRPFTGLVAEPHALPILQIHVVTHNLWGLWLVSKKRSERMR